LHSFSLGWFFTQPSSPPAQELEFAGKAALSANSNAPTNEHLNGWFD
jgi:hypothetical protein